MTFREIHDTFAYSTEEWNSDSTANRHQEKAEHPKVGLSILVPAIKNYRFKNRGETIEMIRSGNSNAVVNMAEYRIFAANKSPQTRKKINRCLSQLSDSLFHISGLPIDPIDYLMCLYYQKNGDQEDGLTIRDISDRLGVLGIEWSHRRLGHFMGTTLGWPLRGKSDRTAAREKRWMKNYSKWLNPFNKHRTNATEQLVETTVAEIFGTMMGPSKNQAHFDLSTYRTLDSTASKLAYLLHCQGITNGSDESTANFLRSLIERGISTRKAAYILTRLNAAFLSSRYPTRFRELVPNFWAATLHRFMTRYLWEGCYSLWFFPASP